MLEELIRERVRIPGCDGTLAGELCYPLDRTSFAALLVNPHPHMGGRTGNRLLVRLAETLAVAGGVTLCFDYAGVGLSEGERIDVAESMSRFWKTGHAPEDERMVEDVRCALGWLSSTSPPPLVLIGYSFGAYAATLALTDEVRALVLISPTIEQHDFSPLMWDGDSTGRVTQRDVPKLILYSDDDFAASREATRRWISALAEPKSAQCIAGGEHFYRGHEDEVAAASASFVEDRLESRPHAPTGCRPVP